MSYSPSEYLNDCEASVVRANLLAKHYPKAYRTKIGGRLEWCDDAALAAATGFAVEVVDKGADREAWERWAVTFHPYHELREGDVRLWVYAEPYGDGSASQWEVLNRIRKRPELHAAILALLKEPR